MNKLIGNSEPLVQGNKGSGVSPNVLSKTSNAVETVLFRPSIQYMKGLEHLPFHVSRFPLGPTQEMIDRLRDGGVEVRVFEDTLDGHSMEKNGGNFPSGLPFVEDETFRVDRTDTGPQIIGYRIDNFTQWKAIVTDLELLTLTEEQAREKCVFPCVMYAGGMNRLARSEFAKLLGGRLPGNIQEIKEISKAIDGLMQGEETNGYNRMSYIGYPVSGYVREKFREYRGIGRLFFAGTSFNETDYSDEMIAEMQSHGKKEGIDYKIVIRQGAIGFDRQRSEFDCNYLWPGDFAGAPFILFDTSPE